MVLFDVDKNVYLCLKSEMIPVLNVKYHNKYHFLVVDDFDHQKYKSKFNVITDFNINDVEFHGKPNINFNLSHDSFKKLCQSTYNKVFG